MIYFAIPEWAYWFLIVMIVGNIVLQIWGIRVQKEYLKLCKEMRRNVK